MNRDYPHLVADCAEAATWMDEAITNHPVGKIFGRVASSVIWSSATDDDGNLLVPVDPRKLARSINAAPYPLLFGHDPGRPMGKVLAAEVFVSDGDETFIAALLGFYDGAPKVGFRDLGLDPDAAVPSSSAWPALPASARIGFAADPREIEPELLEELVSSAPIPVDFQERSHNTAEAQHALVVIGIPMLLLVWNPFVTTFATEAAKDIYAAFSSWLRTVVGRLAASLHPILELQFFHEGCHISFILRGQNVAQLYKAQDAMPGAAVRATHLVGKMTQRGASPVRLIYEFDLTDGVWYPSFAELATGQLVYDNAALIAVENLPSGLSLGISRKDLGGPA